MLNSLSENDKSLNVAQEAFRNTNTRGKKGDITSRLDFVSHQVNKVIYDEIDRKNISEQQEADTKKQGSFSLLKNATDIEEVIKTAISSQVLAVYRQEKEIYIKKLVDTKHASWLVENFDDDPELKEVYINSLREYISSVIKIICKNLIILSIGKGKDSRNIKVASQLSKAWDVNFTKDYFYGNLIQKTLLEAGIDMTPEEIKEAFTCSVKLRFAVNNITDPLDAVRRVAVHLKTTLADDNIQKTLEEANVKMTPEEIKEAFTRSIKLRFAVGNITNPLDAVRRVAVHLKTTLADDNIQKTLEEANVKMTPEKIKEVFTSGVKLCFAVNNITDPLDACVKYIDGEIFYGGKYFAKKKTNAH